MSRTIVVTGAASGIGRATQSLLESAGDTVIGVDLAGSEIDADLSSADGRASLAAGVHERLEGRPLDAVIAVAGVALPSALTVHVNYFGAAATLRDLRPLLDKSDAPRAALVSSFSTVQDVDHPLVDAMRADDESLAAARAEQITADGRGHLVYASTKRAISEWVRRTAITDAWARAGIPLNAVAPGIILTPMTAPLMETDEGRAQLTATVPMPLHGPADPIVIARALAWLTAPENTHITGQVLFVDGGAEASLRGPAIFDTPTPSY
ncbi:SDR family oxidoreductase [Streptomyces shenzhenensis]|uniref:SDR family oxidoreductase n=1 Tax=Streptomyces shenzhenensis TaxID=943815 RepID=UPI00340C9222